jgi:YaiO family outer membrane protein
VKRRAWLVAALIGLAATNAAKAGSFDDDFAAARKLAFSGDRAAAIAAYTDLLARSPDNTDVLLGRGRVYAWLGRWPEAEHDLRAVLAINADYADAWSALGDLFLWSDRPGDAIDAYSAWVALAPEDAVAGRALARARASMGNDNSKPAGDSAVASAATREEVPGGHTLAPDEAPELAKSSEPLWSASLGYSHENLPGRGFSWNDQVATLRRSFSRGSLGVEWLSAERFGSVDHAVALDGYASLWQGAYGNLRVQHSDQATLFPGTRWRTEIFQGVGGGWELSGSYDRFGYSTSVEILGFSAAKYLGNWYLRWRHLYLPSEPNSPGSSNSDQLLARYYTRGDGDSYAQLSVSTGRSDLPTTFFLGNAPAGHSWSASLAWVEFLTKRVGFKVAVDLGYGLESEPSSNHGVSATVYYRW